MAKMVYDIISSDGMGEVVHIVNKHLGNGGSLVGSPFIIEDTHPDGIQKRIIIAQAVLRRADGN